KGRAVKPPKAVWGGGGRKAQPPDQTSASPRRLSSEAPKERGEGRDPPCLRRSETPASRRQVAAPLAAAYENVRRASPLVIARSGAAATRQSRGRLLRVTRSDGLLHLLPRRRILR